MIYYCVYRSNPQNFLFNSDILRSQSSNFKAGAEQELLKLRAKLDANKQLASDLIERSKVPEVKNGELVFSLPSYKFTFFFALNLPEATQQILGVVIQDQNGNEISRDVVAL